MALLTREYPPEVYGGAGRARRVPGPRAGAALVDLTVHCQGEDRAGRAWRHRPWDALAGDRTTALQTVSIDLSMAAGVEGADLVHSHTWYANLAGHLAKLLHGIPHVVTVHSLEPLRPWKAEQLGGGYALSSWCERVALEGADAVIAVSDGMRARHPGRLPGDRPRAGAGSSATASTPSEYPPGPRHRCAGAARRRPGPAVRDLRRADHPAEGRAACCCAPRPQLRPGGAARAVRRARPTPRSSAPRWPALVDGLQAHRGPA